MADFHLTKLLYSPKTNTSSKLTKGTYDSDVILKLYGTQWQENKMKIVFLLVLAAMVILHGGVEIVSTSDW